VRNVTGRPRYTSAIRYAARALRIGALTTVLVALPYKAFDLDRYFVPKELALVVTAGVAAIAALVDARRLKLTRVDIFLAGYLALSAMSAVLATNGWQAERALAVTAAGIALFWSARSMARAGFARSVIAGLALAAVAVAVTSLLQAYGLRMDVFSLNRAPGGTLGNRNFVAHAAAIGLPAVVLSALCARERRAVAGWMAGSAVVAAALVLSRSRDAWLAIGIGAIAVAHALWRTRSRWYTSELGARAIGVGTALTIGGIAAVVLPNSLNWRSRSPYLDSVVGMVDYHEGSGHGRVVQYLKTLRLAFSHPLFGVGPGNWPVVYPHVVGANDLSLDRDDGMTANPWPSSDWAAVLSERGFIAFACLACAFVGLAVEASRAAGSARGAAPDKASPLPALALRATVTIVAVAGAFDAVLLLPAPSLLAWALMGALDGMLERGPIARINVPMIRPARWLLMASVAACAGVAASRSAARASAMELASSDDRARTLEHAGRVDPGSYRIHIRAAELYVRRRDCAAARPHLQRAHALFPYAPEPYRLLGACGLTTPHASSH